MKPKIESGQEMGIAGLEQFYMQKCEAPSIFQFYSHSSMKYVLPHSKTDREKVPSSTVYFSLLSALVPVSHSLIILNRGKTDIN